MSSGFKSALATLVVVVAAGATMDVAMIRAQAASARAANPPVQRTPVVITRAATELRVCADPNNMPFSNARGEGFENALAELVAHDLGRKVRYTWWPQRRGFIRKTLASESCDLVMGVPSNYALAEPTQPYYRSSYVFVSRRDRRLDITSFDDPRLKNLKIGIHTIGDDYNNVPPMQMLALHGLVSNVRGYSIYGDYSQPDPPRRLIDAVASGDVDIALAWGPLAGYFSRREAVPLSVQPVRRDEHLASLPMQFAISMGVRHGNDGLKRALETILTHRRNEVAALLARYNVPTVRLAQAPPTGRE